jgi:hypothetical protein
MSRAKGNEPAASGSKKMTNARIMNRRGERVAAN